VNLSKLFLLALPLPLLACSAEVRPPCDDDCCEEEDCLPPPPDGVAIPWESFAGDRGPAPSGSLLITAASSGGSCAVPHVAPLDCGSGDGAWTLEVPLPPALQFAGATASLADLATLGQGATFVRVSGEGDTCTLETGALEGSVEVLSVSDYDLVLSVSGSQLGDQLELEVPRCFDPTLPQRAIAVSQSRLDAIYANRDIGGGAGDAEIGAPEPPPAEPVYVFIDRSEPALGAVCADPRALQQGCQQGFSQLEVFLPPEVQAPGVYELSSSSVVTVTERIATVLEDEANCTVEALAYSSGTVEILSFGGSLVHVLVSVDDGAPVDALAPSCQ
jgi:hypothetical protein